MNPSPGAWHEHIAAATAPMRYSETLYEGQELNSAVPIMRFTLIYEGPLRAVGDGNSRTREKHEIRKRFHLQLAELWDERPELRNALAHWKENPALPDIPALGSLSAVTRIEDGLEQMRQIGAYREALEERRKRGILTTVHRKDFTFIPLATEEFNLVCDLDILFLRAEEPGSLFTNAAGDLDNRLKLLFDALRVPKDVNELPADARPSAGERPFFCLLGDDKVITAFRVESERLLLPSERPERRGEAKLVIRVTIKTRRVSDVTFAIEID